MKNGLKRIIVCCAAMAFICGCSVHRSGTSGHVQVDSTRTEAAYSYQFAKSGFESYAADVRQQKNVTFVWVRRDTSGQPDSSGQYPIAEEARYTDLSVTDMKLDFKSALDEHVNQSLNLSGTTSTFSQKDKTINTDVKNEIPGIMYSVVYVLLALFLLSCVALYYTNKKS